MFIHLYSFGIGILMADSFARYDDNSTSSAYGPYKAWFERKVFIFYWAVTPPQKNFGYYT